MELFIGASLFAIVFMSMIILVVKSVLGGKIIIGKLIISFEDQNDLGLYTPKISSEDDEL